jgi:hypothetical protein
MALLNKVTDANLIRVAPVMKQLVVDDQLSIQDLLRLIISKGKEDGSYVPVLVRVIEIVSVDAWPEAYEFLDRYIEDSACGSAVALTQRIVARSGDVGPDEYDLFCSVLKSRSRLLNEHKMLVMLSAMVGAKAPSAKVPSDPSTTVSVDMSPRMSAAALGSVQATAGQLVDGVASGAPAMTAIELSLDCFVNAVPFIPVDRDAFVSVVETLLASGLLSSKCRFKALTVLDNIRGGRKFGKG